MNKICAVYILTNSNNSVLYTGVSGDLTKRIIEHKTKKHSRSFSKRYNLEKLVYYEQHDSIVNAISREKQIKAGSRKKKTQLIESLNPDWDELYFDL